MAIPPDEMKKLFGDAEAALHRLSKTVLEGLKPPAGPYGFFHHSGHALARLGDCRKILGRLYRGRERLNELAALTSATRRAEWPRGTPYPEEVQKALREQHSLTGLMQLDLESLYVFGGVLLDQVALQAMCIEPAAWKKKHPFVELLLEFEAGRTKILNDLWTDCRGHMLWLHYNMRFYRNRFVVHSNRPWQRGTTMPVVGEDFNLFTPTPPGWLDDDALDQEIMTLLPFAPKNVRRRGDRVSAATVMEAVFSNIENVDRAADREHIASLLGKKGGSTPTFQVLAERLGLFVRDGARVLHRLASANLGNIDLGRPFMDNEEHWRRLRAEEE